MLRFQVYEGGRAAAALDLEGAHLLGTDHVPIRADMRWRPGELTVTKRAQGPAALAMVWPVPGVGRLLLETTRLLERERPYNLHLELARGQMMRIQQKREEWGLFDIDNIDHLVSQANAAQDRLIDALKDSDGPAGAEAADDVLRLAIPLGENIALFHAGVFLNRRRQAGHLGRHLFGCAIDPTCTADLYRTRLRNGFDFAVVPVSWRQLEPRQGETDFEAVDGWVEWLTAQRIPIKMSPLVSFHERDIPDWLYIYEHDFETVRDFQFEHIRRVVERYRDKVALWDVVSGLHAHNTFNFSLDQLMEMTRMASAITKQMASQALTIIDIVAPWGEYYARNPRTIPPMMYCEMIVQNSINFDVLGVQLACGMGQDGLYVRDMFQFSAMLDRFANFGKPVHITAAQVPSANTPDAADAWNGAQGAATGGAWHDGWTEPVQSRWLREFYNIALSKPFVDTITWRDLSDKTAHYLPHGGLLRQDLSPKLAYEQLCTIRAQIHGNGQNRPPC